MERNTKLSDILHGNTDSLRDQWDNTEAAKDFAPLPAGTYIAHIVSGELEKAGTGTPGYKLKFKVIDGDHAGRLFWHDVWLTPTALPMAKRDLAKLGVTDLDQLEQPLPQGIRCKVKLALRREDDGSEFNRVRSFEVIGIDDDPIADPDFGGEPEPSGDGDGHIAVPPVKVTATPEVKSDDGGDVAEPDAALQSLIDITPQPEVGKVGLPDVD